MIGSLLLAGALTITPMAGETSQSRLASSMKGFDTSLYQGKWYHPRWEKKRKCIMWRESRFNYRAANKRSSARGAYQFLDRQWRKSLTYMLMPEHKSQRKEVRALRDKPINQWNRYWQDAAFYTAWRHGKGAKHWHLTGSKCG